MQVTHLNHGIRTPASVDRFSGFVPSRERFRRRLKTTTALSLLVQDPKRTIRNILFQIIADDSMEILSDFRDVLDVVDESMSDDRLLRQCLQSWRILFGQWKKNLPNDLRSVTYMSDILFRDSDAQHVGIDQPHSTSINKPDEGLFAPSRADFEETAQQMKDLIMRAESTFQAIMATMAIVESQKAITQAETITKLTNLAFYFIPITLTASIFGMNIKVSTYVANNTKA